MESAKTTVQNDTELSQKYQQKTDREHILSTPDTYIGSVEQMEDTHWILNETGTKIVSKSDLSTVKFGGGMTAFLALFCLVFYFTSFFVTIVY